jgi:predicted peptidase
MLTIAVLHTAGLPEASGQAGSPATIPALSPGMHVRSFSAGAFTVGYAIAIPEGYSAAEPVPLILALHYGGSPNGAGAGVLSALVQPALADLGAIIVAPESVRGQWNSPENEGAVNALLDGVLNSYSIDRKRIAVTGFSMGGAGTWHFAAKYPERFSAAIPVAGRPTPSAEGWRLPVLAVHSTEDEVVPIGPAQTRIAELKNAGVRADIVVLTGITHYQTNRFVDGLRKAVPWLQEIWASR